MRESERRRLEELSERGSSSEQVNARAALMAAGARAVPRVQVVAAVICRAGRIMLAQRDPNRDFGWVWESPGGKVDGKGETYAAALRRELWEELYLVATDVEIGDMIAAYDFDPDERCAVVRPCRVTFFRVRIGAAVPIPKHPDVTGLGWFLPNEARALAVTPANQRLFLDRPIEDLCRGS